jgi:hypothetical protein
VTLGCSFGGLFLLVGLSLSVWIGISPGRAQSTMTRKQETVRALFKKLVRAPLQTQSGKT